MTCVHCEKSVREQVGGIDRVEQVDVRAATGKLFVVTSTEPIDAAAVPTAVGEAGYTAARVYEHCHSAGRVRRRSCARVPGRNVRPRRHCVLVAVQVGDDDTDAKLNDAGDAINRLVRS